MTLAFTIALVCAAANGCVCVCHEQSPFERDCRERGGQVRSTAKAQTCVTDAGVTAHVEVLDSDDAGG